MVLLYLNARLPRSNSLDFGERLVISHSDENNRRFEQVDNLYVGFSILILDYQNDASVNPKTNSRTCLDGRGMSIPQKIDCRRKLKNTWLV